MQNSAVFSIKDAFEISGRGTVVVGFVESGEISVGMWGDIDGIKVRVLEIEAFHKNLKTVGAGEYKGVGLTIEGVRKEDIKMNQKIIFD